MPHFGGRRAYFLCPECRARVESLYAAPYLACRSCHHLAYQSENLTPLWRKSGKLRKLQEKADADTSRLPCILAKPKWMRWHTYLSLRRKIQEADRNFAAAWMEVAAWSHALSGASRLACHASVAGPELKGGTVDGCDLGRKDADASEDGSGLKAFGAPSHWRQPVLPLPDRCAMKAAIVSHR